MDSGADPAAEAGTPGDRVAGDRVAGDRGLGDGGPGDGGPGDGAPSDRVAGAAGRRRPVVALVGVAAAVLLVDVISKIIVVAQLTPGQSIRLLGGAVYFSLIRNSGAAFGLAGGLTVVFALV
jgi:hypothetical protein